MCSYLSLFFYLICCVLLGTETEGERDGSMKDSRQWRRDGGGERYLWLSSLIKTTPAWVVLLHTSTSLMYKRGAEVCVCVRAYVCVCERVKRVCVCVVSGVGAGVEEGIPFNCNHSGSTAGTYMPCIQLEKGGEERACFWAQLLSLHLVLPNTVEGMAQNNVCSCFLICSVQWDW